MDKIDVSKIRLTEYSHGAGCGCKISPKLLDQILMDNLAMPDDKKLIVGNHSRDDAAVYDLGNGTALISTTDFFMPIVDDPYDFGCIASANAISDVYAMGGKPILAVAILGWPVNRLPTSVAQKVIAGCRSICAEAGIPLGGGHSIDSPEPIFGLAVNGIIDIHCIKQNNTARPGDILFLTKKLGVGILTTAEKKGLLKAEHSTLASAQMKQLNKVGETLGKTPGVHAMTDVTGFGFLGHLCEMAEGSGMSAVVYFKQVPVITPSLEYYTGAQCIPGGTIRNWDSYGEKIAFDQVADQAYAKAILADPQTSGGLLIAVAPEHQAAVSDLLSGLNLYAEPVGMIVEKKESTIIIQNV